ncbi:hypothetical protein [Clostridium lundense]|uniref:hypothetical protein n=1 Tax=Clostridium lundense TaxID=319475 RepID=UPI00048142CD|nr:hypothetical protein [Clostridium lundense]
MKDKIFLDILENFNEDDLKSLINDLNIDESYDISNESLNRIKEKTFDKIDKSPIPSEKITENKPKRSFLSSKKKAAIAATISFLLLIPFSNKAIANIKKVLQYIPGINQVLENEPSSNIYVLESNIKVPTKNGYVELLSVLIDTDKKIIQVSARGEEKNGADAPNMDVASFTPAIKLNNGKTIKLNNGSTGSGGGDGSMHWQSDFSSDNKNISYTDGEKIEVELTPPYNEKITIPVTLKKVKDYSNYKEMGPTCNNNGISITAIPKWENNTLKVNLLTPSNNEWSVQEYGKDPNYTDKNCSYKGVLNKTIMLTDDEGKSYKISAPGSYSPPLSEFYFDASKSNHTSYKLNIPYVRIKHSINVKHSFNIPKLLEKVTFHNEIITLKDDYKIKILSLERPAEDQLIIKIDTGYHEDKSDSIFNVELGTDDKLLTTSDYNGWSSDYSEDNKNNVMGNLKGWCIRLNHPKSSKLDLYIGSFYTIKKGPWIIPIDKNKITDNK